MKKYIICPEGRTDLRESFIKRNPHIKDVEFVDAIKETNVSSAILLRNKMTISEEFPNITPKQIATLIDHRKLWWFGFEKSENILVSNVDATFTEDYDDEKFEELMTNGSEIILLSGGSDFSSYIANPSFCQQLMSSDILHKISPVEEVVSSFIPFFKYYVANVVNPTTPTLPMGKRKHKFKYYVLTSSNYEGLLRHTDPRYTNMPKEDMIIVINTKSDEYKQHAVDWCEKEGIEYYITESNGTPARGKNTVIDLFLESDNDYMVLVDGDDFLTPHGIWLHDYLSKQDSPPDAVCLKHQISTVLDREKVEAMQTVDPRFLSLEEIPTQQSMYFTANWEAIENASIYPHLIDYGCSNEDAIRFDNYHKEFYRLQKKYCEDNESHCRITWMSRETLKKHRFPEHLIVGEDTVFYFNVKKDGLEGNLDVKCNDERPATYVYDQRVPGTVHNEVKEGTDWNWMGVYNEEVHSLEKKGIVMQEDLPLLEIEYPEKYFPNTLGISESVPFNYSQNDDQVGTIYSPMNSSQNSLHKKVQSPSRFYK